MENLLVFCDFYVDARHFTERRMNLIAQYIQARVCRDSLVTQNSKERFHEIWRSLALVCI